MNRTVSAEMLKGNAFTRGLSEKTLSQIALSAHVLDLPDRSIIYEEGDIADSLYLIYSGKVEFTRKRLGFGDSVVVSLRQPGHFFGETSLIDRGNRPVRATTVGPCRLIRITADTFDWVLLEQGDVVARNLIEAAVQSSRNSSDLLLNQVIEQQKREVIQTVISWLTQKTQDGFTGLRLNIATLLRDLNDPTLRDIVVEVQNEVENLINLFRDLTLFSDTAPLTRTERATTLLELWKPIEPMAKKLTKDKHLTLDAYVEDSAVDLDSHLVESALQHAIIGIAEIAAAGSTIQIRGGIRKGEIEFRINYRHPKITEYVALRLFEPFLTSSSGEPSGVNLALAKRYIERAGGKATVPIRGGEEVTLSLSLPRERTL
jgi:CRP-like cAMP-binding protein